MDFYTQSEVLNAPFINKERLGPDFGGLMVLAPHPDDESLGCGGLISLFRQANSNVSVLFVTDGTASHTSRTHPPKILRSIRESEALKACSTLGVDSDQVYFLAERDSGLTNYTRPKLLELAEQIASVFEKEGCSTLAIPWRRDPHPDHIVVNRLGNLLLEKSDKRIVIIEYPVWLWTNGQQGDWPLKSEIHAFRLDISSVIDRKIDAIGKHRSQLGELIFDDPNGFTLSDVQLAPFNRPVEVFFISKDRNRSTLSEQYFEDLYAMQNDPWNFADSPYEKQKYADSMLALGRENFDRGLELGCSIGIQTALLAKICNRLLAVDISRKAISTATLNCTGFDNIEFMVRDITMDFPIGEYDLITCCEIGYYLEPNDLVVLFGKMCDCLNPHGKLLMVHWTPFVPEYPLTGNDVHTMFEQFVEGDGDIIELIDYRKDKYRLQVWGKGDIATAT